jgi:hypothetical protein
VKERWKIKMNRNAETEKFEPIRAEGQIEEKLE